MCEKKYMELAIKLAKRGTGYVNPNPLVGAVVEKNGIIIGQGWHQEYGGFHAERNALKSCTSPHDSTLYVTLTPCCHYGKTPPCTDAIIENKIKKVVIGSRDPNPLVGEKSIEVLKNAGIEVITDFMKEECDALNPVFFHYIKAKTPYVVMKFASTLDGKIATCIGESKWITNEASRNNVHKSRHKYAGIMVGINTVLKDDPLLTCRIENGKNPIRIVCDTRLQTPLTSLLVKTAKEVPLIIATAVNNSEELHPYLEKGCQILQIQKNNDGHINLNELMKKLGKLNIDSILLEGGSTLNEAALKSGIVNKVEAYISPKLLGGKDSPSPVAGDGFLHLEDAIKLNNIKITQIENDILVEGEVKQCSQEL